MRFLIGFGLIVLGGVLSAVTGFIPFFVILFVGVFLFASLTSEAVFYDYRIANTDEFLVRKRMYLDFIPLTVVSLVLTLGKASLKIIYKEKYFKVTATAEESAEPVEISRKEYISLRNSQRVFYSTQTLSRTFMESSYSIEDIGLKRKKTRLVIASVLAAVILTTLAVPGGIYLGLIYEAVFIPMIVVWIPEYKDAKILQQAYDNAMKSST